MATYDTAGRRIAASRVGQQRARLAEVEQERRQANRARQAHIANLGADEYGRDWQARRQARRRKTAATTTADVLPAKPKNPARTPSRHTLDPNADRRPPTPVPTQARLERGGSRAGLIPDPEAAKQRLADAIRRQRTADVLARSAGQQYRQMGKLRLPREAEAYDGAQRHMALIVAAACRAFGWSWAQMRDPAPAGPLRGLIVDRRVTAVVCANRTAATRRAASEFLRLSGGAATETVNKLMPRDSLYRWRRAILDIAVDELEAKGILHKVAAQRLTSGLAEAGHGPTQMPENRLVHGGMST